MALSISALIFSLQFSDLKSARMFIRGFPYKQVITSPVAEILKRLQLPQKVREKEGIIPKVPM